MPRRIVSLFRNLLRKHAVEQALDDELQSSVEILTEEKMRGGLSRSVALRQARIELGGVEQVKRSAQYGLGAFWRTSPGTCVSHSAL